jgi:hypothetical protein
MEAITNLLVKQAVFRKGDGVAHVALRVFFVPDGFGRCLRPMLGERSKELK